MDISVVPANEASWADLQTVFGTRGEPARCQCQWFKITAAEWRSVPVGERARRLHEQTGCDDPAAESSSGLVAYFEGSRPAGARSSPARCTPGWARLGCRGRGATRGGPIRMSGL